MAEIAWFDCESKFSVGNNNRVCEYLTYYKIESVVIVTSGNYDYETELPLSTNKQTVIWNLFILNTI